MKSFARKKEKLKWKSLLAALENREEGGNFFFLVLFVLRLNINIQMGDHHWSGYLCCPAGLGRESPNRKAVVRCKMHVKCLNRAERRG